MPILTRTPGRRRAAGARSRSSTKTRCSMCQSCVCSRIAAPRTSAQAWVICCTLSRVVPLAGHRHPVVEADDDPVPPAAGQAGGRLVVDRRRVQRRAGGHGERGRPHGHPRRCPQQVDLDATLGEVAVGEQGHERAAAQAPTAARAKTSPPPVSGMIVMPSDSRKARNSANTSSGSSRSATVVTGARLGGRPGAAAMSQLPRWPRKHDAPRPVASCSRTGPSPSARTVGPAASAASGRAAGRRRSSSAGRSASPPGRGRRARRSPSSGRTRA